MIVLSNTTAQTLATGQSITFDRVILKTGCAECHYENSSSVKLLAGCGAIYEISFSGNIAGGAATEVELSIELGGEVLEGTTMIQQGTASTAFRNVSVTRPVRIHCNDYTRLTVTNTGESNVVVGAGSLFYVKRSA